MFSSKTSNNCAHKLKRKFSKCKLICPHVAFFHPIDESAVHDFIAAWGRVVAGKVPIAGVAWAGHVEVLDGLVDDFYIGLHALRGEHLGNFGRDFGVGEGFVDALHHVFHLFFRQLYLLERSSIDFVDEVGFTGLAQ